MAKIFEFSGGSYIDKVSGAVGVPSGGWSWARTEKGLAWRGNGVDSLITLGATTVIGTVFSFSCWVRLIDNSSSFRVLAGYTNDSYPLILRADLGLMYTHDGISNVSDIRLEITDGEWHHILVTREDTSVYFYVDGVIGAEKTLATNNAISIDRLFRRASAFNYKGNCANIQIYDHVLTSNERAKLLNEFNNSYPITRTIS